MTLRSYDEAAMVSRLGRLDRPCKTAFAASCAQRLLPLYERYARTVGEPESAARLRGVIDAAWEAASGGQAEVQTYRSVLEELAPTEDGDWTFEMGYAQNAVASAFYAIQTWLNDDPRDAVWAARQVYELADYAAQHRHPGGYLLTPEAERSLLGTPDVQAALEAIERLLAAVESGPQACRDLRASDEAAAVEWAASLP